MSSFAAPTFSSGSASDRSSLVIARRTPLSVGAAPRRLGDDVSSHYQIETPSLLDSGAIGRRLVSGM